MSKNHVSSLSTLLSAVILLFAFCGTVSGQQNVLEEEKQAAGQSRKAASGYDMANYEIAAPRSQTFKSEDAVSMSLGTEKQLSDISHGVAEKIYKELQKKDGDQLAAKVAVTVAVPLSDLKRETEFGRMLAEYTLTDLADRGLQVAEIRLGKEIIILPQTGEFIMSRNIGELINDSPKVDYVVVSTFTNTRSTLILQGRLVDMKDGIVQTSWRYTMPLNREILGLFYDPREMRPSAAKPFKMAVKGLGE